VIESAPEVLRVLFGGFAGLVGLLYLATRMDCLSWSKYRADYVLMHFALGAGCMVVSACMISGALQHLWIVGVSMVTVVCCHISVTSKGHAMWEPPTYMQTHKEDEPVL
jgi:hypothetical protein